jgi:hypothetical protein
MKHYTVYFQVFDKKMKVSIRAKSQEEAQAKVMKAIFIHKIQVENIEDPRFTELKNIFGIK